MNTSVTSSEDLAASQRDQLTERLLQSASGYFNVLTIHLGDRLGFYRSLAQADTLSPGELAKRTGTYERYTREWLEQQTVAQIIEVIDENAPAKERRYRLPMGHIEVLTDRDSINYLAPLTQLVVGVGHPLETLIQAYCTGEGVPFEAYGKNFRDGVAELNRPLFLRQLATEYLPAIADIHQRLLSDPPARVADIGCGVGWSSIGMAKAYPKILIDGIDLDIASIDAARANAIKENLENRLSFHVRDASDPSLAVNYDLVTAFECIHDMSDPVGALEAMLKLAGKKGSVLVMDERTNDKFTPQGNEIEGLLYGFSVLACLPSGMAGKPSAQTGAVMRPETLRQYATEAGFCDVEILPIDNFFFRFYRLKAACDV